MDDIKRTTLEEFLEEPSKKNDSEGLLENLSSKNEDNSNEKEIPDNNKKSDNKPDKKNNNSEEKEKENSFQPNIYLLPVHERPFFPGQILPVIVSRTLWGNTFKILKKLKIKYIGIIFVTKETKNKNLNPADFSKIGTLVRVDDLKIKSDYIQFIAEGIKRFQIESFISIEPPFQAKVTYPEDTHNSSDKTLKAYGLAIINTFKDLLPLNPLYSEELKYFLTRFNLSDPAQLADFATSLTSANNHNLQEILDTLDLDERLEKVLTLLKDEVDLTKIQSNIRKKVEDNISEQQRDFFLKQQLKEIQRELGVTKDDKTLDVELFTKRISKLKLSTESDKKIKDELQKINVLEPHSSEYAVSRNWLDWITQLPWGNYSKDKLNLIRARKILDKGHYGLEDVKDRILEFLAVGVLKGEISGSIICLVGPPGVGKTSIGRSVANALGRKFYRFSVGGMRDEAEIKGHRRTYIGAMPGKFIQALKDCSTSNPVIMLDEIDKMGNSHQGDPISALLEALDPEQNNEFMDNYLDVRFDLSKAMFICTANTLDTLPAPLLDRMEIIRLSGYITEEKIKIAKNYLWPSLVKDIALSRSQIKITTKVIRQVIEGYARESGVRSLKKKLSQIIRKVAMQIVSDKISVPLSIKVNDLEKILGKPRFTPEKINLQIGTVTGLAWTSMGGATLTIESARIHTLNRGIKLSGQLGDVMKESAGIAYSYIASNLKKYQAEPTFFDKAFIHLHVPDGATPKDGPSAGVTIATALLSLARKEAITSNLAMTGELSLTGQVLPVGGIREKIIASKRIGIKTVILPNENKKDYDELPDYLKKNLNIHFVKHFDDVTELTFSRKK